MNCVVSSINETIPNSCVTFFVTYTGIILPRHLSIFSHFNVNREINSPSPFRVCIRLPCVFSFIFLNLIRAATFQRVCVCVYTYIASISHFECHRFDERIRRGERIQNILPRLSLVHQGRIVRLLVSSRRWFYFARRWLDVSRVHGIASFRTSAESLINGY